MLKLWYNPRRPEHNLCLQQFEQIMVEYPDVQFFQPNAEAAPWHVQAIFPRPDGTRCHLDFWPHKMKGRADNGASVAGPQALRDLLELALAESGA